MRCNRAPWTIGIFIAGTSSPEGVAAGLATQISTQHGSHYQAVSSGSYLVITSNDQKSAVPATTLTPPSGSDGALASVGERGEVEHRVGLRAAHAFGDRGGGRLGRQRSFELLRCHERAQRHVIGSRSGV